MDGKFLSLMVMFIMIFFAFASSLIFDTQFGQLVRANTAVPSPKTSIILANRYVVPTDDEESVVQVTVFLMSEESEPVPNRLVGIDNTSGVMEPTQVVTDEKGRADFTFSCTQQEDVQVQARIDNQVLLEQDIVIMCE